MYIRLTFATVLLFLIYVGSKYVLTPMHLYYEIPWLDKPMHVIGGATVALFVISLYAIFRNKAENPPLTLVLFYTLLVAFAWEVYEVIHDHLLVKPWNGWYDSITDILCGIVGGFVAYLLHKNKYI